jgi:hypothetical protein
MIQRNAAVGTMLTANNVREAAMKLIASLTRAEHAKVRAHLQTLRRSLSQARDALMHFKDDRLDRDKLEPAARRADDLVNMFSGDVRDSTQWPLWVGEIQSGVEQVTNPKAAAALRDARVDIAALLEAIGRGANGSAAAAVPALPAGSTSVLI